MISQYHNHKLQTNPWHREEELLDIYRNKTSKKTIKANQPALFSSSRWLQNYKRTKRNAYQNKTKTNTDPPLTIEGT